MSGAILYMAVSVIDDVFIPSTARIFLTKSEAEKYCAHIDGFRAFKVRLTVFDPPKAPTGTKEGRP